MVQDYGDATLRRKRRGTAEHAAAETSGQGRPRCGGNVGARQNTLWRKRRRTAEHAAAETSAHGRLRCGGNVGARQNTLWRKRRGTACRAPTPGS